MSGCVFRAFSGSGHGSLAALLGQLDDRVDHRLERLVAEHHGAEHDLFRQLLRLGFDHQHAFGGAGDDEVELRGRQLVEPRVEHVSAVDIADARAAIGPRNGMPEIVSAAEAPIIATMSGSFSRSWLKRGADDLGLVAEAGGEQRPDRPVDQARGQHLLLGRPAFALEEAARDLARGEGLLLVVDGQREEIDAGLRRWRWPTAVHSTMVSP